MLTRCGIHVYDSIELTRLLRWRVRTTSGVPARRAPAPASRVSMRLCVLSTSKPPSRRMRRTRGTPRTKLRKPPMGTVCTRMPASSARSINLAWGRQMSST
ncbi:Uncharacterised protein [Bordetella pertussis]|nr:Uncharacterised protein [Bordetella pertussis]